MTDRELLENILERVKRLEINLLPSQESLNALKQVLASQMNTRASAQF